MKKTVFLLLLLMVTVFTFVACNDDETTTDPPAEEITYTVTWIDENGSTISSASVKEGEIPSCNYSVTDTAEWDYTFEGWSATENGEILSSIPAVSCDATYYAHVSAIKQKYTVIFNSNGGSAVDPQSVEYGGKATIPESPVYEGHKFMGWCLSPDGSEVVDFEKVITSNVEYYAVWNEVIDVKGLLVALLNGYEMNPFGNIPESMRIDFSNNLVDSDEIISDYSGFVSTSDICYGFGEQWHMVLDNLSQSQIFFNTLSVIDGLSTASIAAFNNYFDSNPSDTAHHEFESGIYNVTINFDGRIISYVLDYTAELPALGEQTVQIALSMVAETGEKVVRIQLGDANALTYKILENSYEFAIKYLGVRRAMFSIEKNENGEVNGKIYEYLTVSSAEVASSAEFFITEDYVSVVGNKASGLIGFTGYICELYDAKTGKMFGYEVQETLSSIVYNTLWFDLKDITGISSIKYVPATDETPAKMYVNGSSAEWKTKNVGGIGAKMFSRRFDIEFRTQYVYSYDATTEKYIEYVISVPMIFVQEENYDTFIDDVEATNDITLSVDLMEDDLNKLLGDYDALILVFIENKGKVTPEYIIEYIGEKIVFDQEA